MMKIVQEQLKGKPFDIVLCIYFVNYDIITYAKSTSASPNKPILYISIDNRAMAIEKSGYGVSTIYDNLICGHYNYKVVVKRNGRLSPVIFAVLAAV